MPIALSSSLVELDSTVNSRLIILTQCEWVPLGQLGSVQGAIAHQSCGKECSGCSGFL